MEAEHLGGQQHKPGVHPDQQAGHDRVRQRPGDDPVDIVQMVFQDPYAHADRQRRDPEKRDIPDRLITRKAENHKRQHKHGSAAHQPLELVPTLPSRAQVTEELAGHPGQAVTTRAT